jgi:hypothetical protein
MGKTLCLPFDLPGHSCEGKTPKKTLADATHYIPCHHISCHPEKREGSPTSALRFFTFIAFRFRMTGLSTHG